MQFSRHYTLDEARALLPEIRGWLAQLDQLHHDLKSTEKVLEYPVRSGRDMGGETVNAQARLLSQIQRVQREFSRRQIQLKDLARGLIDFPALRDGREVFLCWEKDDDDIEFWHDLDAGYAGRERI
jgi:hypothetical protein